MKVIDVEIGEDVVIGIFEVDPLGIGLEVGISTDMFNPGVVKDFVVAISSVKFIPGVVKDFSATITREFEG